MKQGYLNVRDSRRRNPEIVTNCVCKQLRNVGVACSSNFQMSGGACSSNFQISGVGCSSNSAKAP
eukprot:414434-Alexandrium_andersonii.AAC.1